MTIILFGNVMKNRYGEGGTGETSINLALVVPRRYSGSVYDSCA